MKDVISADGGKFFKHIAPLVAKGFKQKNVGDEKKLVAPVVKMATPRMILW